MRIAVAADRGMVAPHFGRCEEYVLFDLEGDKVTSKLVVPNPGHAPGFLPQYLYRMGVDCLIAGGMGTRAQGLFAEWDIEIVVGVDGPVDRVVNDFILGKIKPGVYGNVCNREGEHGCGHEEER